MRSTFGKSASRKYEVDEESDEDYDDDAVFVSPMQKKRSAEELPKTDFAAKQWEPMVRTATSITKFFGLG